VYDIFGRGGGEKVAAEMDVPYLGAIPIDPLVRQGGDEGTPIVATDPESPAAKALEAIAGELAAKVSVLNFNRPKQRAFEPDPDLAIG